MTAAADVTLVSSPPVSSSVTLPEPATLVIDGPSSSIRTALPRSTVSRLKSPSKSVAVTWSNSAPAAMPGELSSLLAMLPCSIAMNWVIVTVPFAATVKVKATSPDVSPRPSTVPGPV